MAKRRPLKCEYGWCSDFALGGDTAEECCCIKATECVKKAIADARKWRWLIPDMIAWVIIGYKKERDRCQRSK